MGQLYVTSLFTAYLKECGFFKNVSNVGSTIDVGGKMKKFLVIHKNSLFYDVYGDDAVILHYLLDYKIIKGRVGFPENAKLKVVNMLEEKKINYKIVDEEEVCKDFKNLNQYNTYLIKSEDKIKLNLRVENILKKMEEMDSNSLYEVLEKIESFIYE